MKNLCSRWIPHNLRGYKNGPCYLMQCRNYQIQGRGVKFDVEHSNSVHETQQGNFHVKKIVSRWVPHNVAQAGKEVRVEWYVLSLHYAVRQHVVFHRENGNITKINQTNTVSRNTITHISPSGVRRNRSQLKPTIKETTRSVWEIADGAPHPLSVGSFSSGRSPD
ncbi:hypothetical protein EVAR_31007_1 [Eumeta japonica]|uniref:Uncharacterized protein n=1 Tax=Eumeta variegata TaxID=151549 RepID=A0A4C1VEH6_EUMVA|nr:hypothetical protein EVAR_31007_1 [Eumeta japonica]